MSTLWQDLAFALALLLLTHWGMWLITRFWMCINYVGLDFWKVSARFPGRRKFLIAKLILGVAFASSLVAAMRLGDPGFSFSLLALGLYVAFALTSFLDSWRSFHYYVANNLPPRDADGYIPRR